MKIKLVSVVHYYNNETVSSQGDWDHISNDLDMRMAFILFKLRWAIPFSRDFIGTSKYITKYKGNIFIKCNKVLFYFV